MANTKQGQLPAFLKQTENNSLVYNGAGELLYYIPETYFVNTKNPVAEIVGQFVSTIGVFDWALVTETGKVSSAKPFKYPTIIKCKPHSIEKVKELSLNGLEKKDYRILHFMKDDEAISDIYIPQIIDNVETMFRTSVINGGKLPPTVPYDKLHEYYPDSMRLNGNNFGLNMQMFGIMVSKLCRDPNDISKPFRYTSMDNMNKYQMISIDMISKFTSPYTAITSNNFDEGLMASMLIDPKDIKSSPLEKVVSN